MDIEAVLNIDATCCSFLVDGGKTSAPGSKEGYHGRLDHSDEHTVLIVICFVIRANHPYVSIVSKKETFSDMKNETIKKIGKSC